MQLKTLIAGPWVGEFGWELFCWHAYIRSLSKHFDKTVCISSPFSKFMYDDFCDNFVAFTPRGGDYKDSYYKVGFKIDATLIGSTLKDSGIEMGSNSSLLVPRRIGDPPRTHFSEIFKFGKYPIKPEYLKFGKKNEKYRNTVVLHARDRNLRKGDNWNREKWNLLVDKLNDLCYNIISIGLKSEAIHIEGSEDKRECNQQELLDILNNSVCIFGPSSGAMHLASLCGCPQVVWTTDYNLNRYTKNWNPHSTKVLFLSEYGWQPSAVHVFEKFQEWIKNV
mgnify:CR=1 FL=1